MKAVLSSMVGVPLVLVGCLTLPVSGSRLENETAGRGLRGLVANPTPVLGRRRRQGVLRPEVAQEPDRAHTLGEATNRAGTIAVPGLES